MSNKLVIVPNFCAQGKFHTFYGEAEVLGRGEVGKFPVLPQRHCCTNLYRDKIALCGFRTGLPGWSKRVWKGSATAKMASLDEIPKLELVTFIAHALSTPHSVIILGNLSMKGYTVSGL